MTPDWHRKTISWSGAQSATWENTGNLLDEGSISTFVPDAGCKVIIQVTTP